MIPFLFNIFPLEWIYSEAGLFETTVAFEGGLAIGFCNAAVLFAVASHD